MPGGSPRSVGCVGDRGPVSLCRGHVLWTCVAHSSGLQVLLGSEQFPRCGGFLGFGRKRYRSHVGVMMLLPDSVLAAVTEGHRLGVSSNRHQFLLVLESEVQVLADSVSADPPPGSPMAPSRCVLTWLLP